MTLFEHTPVSKVAEVVEWCVANQTTLLGIGIAYMLTMILLTTVETLFRDGTLPSLDQFLRDPGRLTAAERRVRWIRPHTTDVRTPVADEVKARDVFIGSVDDVAQYISVQKTMSEKAGVQEYSEEWSNVVGCPVYVYKKRMR